MAKKRKTVLSNDSQVVAHTTNNQIIKWKMGDLKRAFLSNKLPHKVVFVYYPKKNKNYYISYHPTKGFKYKELSQSELDNLRKGGSL